jgi:hypothetical protein
VPVPFLNHRRPVLCRLPILLFFPVQSGAAAECTEG